jgi:hypothetical protein
MNTINLIKAGAIALTTLHINTYQIAHATVLNSKEFIEPYVFAYAGSNNLPWVKSLPGASHVKERQCKSESDCTTVSLGYLAPNPELQRHLSGQPNVGTDNNTTSAERPSPQVDAQPTMVFATIQDPRGPLIKQLPLSRVISKQHCKDQVCKPLHVGYLAPVPANWAELLGKQTNDSVNDIATGTHAAAAMDSVTTAVGLAGGAVELNPLLGASPSPLTLVGLAALKMAYVNDMAKSNDVSDQQKVGNLCTASAVMGAASYNNLVVIAGGVGALPVVLALAASRYQFNDCITTNAVQDHTALAKYIAHMKAQAQATEQTTVTVPLQTPRQTTVPATAQGDENTATTIAALGTP